MCENYDLQLEPIRKNFLNQLKRSQLGCQHAFLESLQQYHLSPPLVISQDDTKLLMRAKKIILIEWYVPEDILDTDPELIDHKIII